MQLHEKEELSKIIIEHALSKHKKIFTSCSFGKDSLVIAKLVLQVKPDIEFIGIDTGYEFKETLYYADELIKDWNMNFTWARPSEEYKKEIEEKYGEEWVKDGQWKCCAMKFPAIESHLSNYDAWITGLRRDETEDRKDIKIFENGKIVKINPIAFWTEEDIWNFIKQKGLKYHPLYDNGYKSLGCEPCTTRGDVKLGGGRQGKFEQVGK